MDNLISQDDAIESILNLQLQGRQSYRQADYQNAKRCFIQAIQQIQTLTSNSNNANDSNEAMMDQTQCDIYLDLCKIYIRQDKYDQAMKYVEMVQPMATRLQDPIRSAQRLDRQGEIMLLRDQYKEALQYFNHSLEMKLNVLGNDDSHNLDLAESYHFLSKVYCAQGQYDLSLSNCEKALDIRIRLLDKYDIDVIESQLIKAKIYIQLSKYDEALSIHVQYVSAALEMSEGTSKDYVMANLYNDMGVIEDYRSKYDEALSKYEISLRCQLKLFGDNHTEVATSYHNIGGIYYQQSKFNEALSMYQISLNIRLKLLGANHTRVAVSYSSIACVYIQQYKYDEALWMYQKSLNIQLILLGDDHADVALLYSSIGNVYIQQSRYDEALAMYQKSLNIRFKLFEDNHTDVAISYHGVGNCYYYQSKYDQALSMYQKSLKIRLKLLGDNHRSVATLYNNIGNIYIDQSKYDEALSMYQNSLNIRLKLLGDNHPDVAELCINIANIYFHQSKYSMALVRHQQASDIYVNLFGENHARLVEIYSDIADIHDIQNNHAEAVAMRRKSQQISNNLRVSHQMDDQDSSQLQESGNNNQEMTQDRILDDENVDVINNTNDSQITNEGARDYIIDDDILDEIYNVDDDQTSNEDSQDELDEDSTVNSTPSDSNDNQKDVLEEARYYKAYNKASHDGRYANAFIRIILAGPPNVGKTSIRKVFTKLGLHYDASPTLVAEISDQIYDIITYEFNECKTCDFTKVLNRKIIAAIESFLQPIDQYTLNLDRQIQDLNLSMNDALQSQIHINDRSIYNVSSNTQLQAPYEQNNQSNIEMNKQQSITESQNPNDDGDVTTYSYHNNIQTNRSKLQAAISRIYQQLRLQLQDQSERILDQQFGKLFDFGGQPIYHITHRPFMSANSIYILVFNITQDVHQQVVTRDGQSINMTYLELMQEWLTSIIGGNSNHNKITATINNRKSKYSLPIIILVASHGDYIDTEQQRINKFIQFEESLISHLPIYKSNIYSSRIIFNCKDKDESEATINHRRQCCQKLHTIINGFVGSLPFMSRDYGIPLRWYIIAAILHLDINHHHNDDVITQLRDIASMDINKIMKLSDIRKLIKECGLYESDDELYNMLLYLHDIGEIIFCQLAKDDGVIITDVDWFLMIMRDIIRLHDPEAENVDIISQYRHLKRTGKMSQDYIDYILDNNNLTKQDKIITLQLLENYNIICKIESASTVSMQYFVPYLLQPEIETMDLTDFIVSEKLYIGYEHQEMPYIPDGIFYCLLTSCLKEWNNPEVQVYHQCVKYYLSDDLHYVIVKKEKSHISMQYCYQKLEESEGVQDFINKIEISINEKRPHKLIKNKLSEIVMERLPKFKKANCQFYVRCTKTNCQQLTPMESKNNPIRSVKVLCCHCKRLFDSQPIRDWMIYERKKLNVSEERKDAESKISTNQPTMTEITVEDFNGNPMKIFISEPGSPAKLYFIDIYQHIGIHWKELARKLNVDQTAIDTIQASDPQSPNEQCMTMLNGYQRNTGDSFTKLKLVKVLISAGLREVAERCKLYKL